jgi:two-component system chemotaxis response regulator CheY
MLKVLIVDDSLIIRNILKKHFEELGHEVVGLAKTGQEALSMHHRFWPDLVTMDISMPFMDGLEALKEIKKDFHDANIMMITSQGEQHLVMEAIANGAKGYILKPITKENINHNLTKIFPEMTEELI